jgi:nucleotide-binding universal stress UspA family protein
MSKNSAVVVGVDGSEASWAALDWAIAYAKERRLTVTVLAGVVTVPGEEMFGGVMQERIDDTEKTMREAVRRCRLAGVEATGMTSVVPAAQALLTASEDAVALVVGVTGRGRIGATLWGSVTRHVTRHAEVPVVVVREPVDPEATRVVAAVDGTPVGNDVLGFALDVASRHGGNAEMLHAVDGPGSWRSWTEKVDEEQAARDAAVDRLVAELGAGWREKYPDVTLATSVVHEDAADALVGASDGAALLVLGAHGHHGVKRHLGSVTQAVVRQARCPVAVLH